MGIDFTWWIVAVRPESRALSKAECAAAAGTSATSSLAASPCPGLTDTHIGAIIRISFHCYSDPKSQPIDPQFALS